MISQYQEKINYLTSLVDSLEQSTIDGSAITMCLLPKKNINQYTSLLASEIAQAYNIKDKSNRSSVLQGLKSAKQALKDYKKVPSNGLIVVAANCMLPNRHVYQKVVQVIEPHRPITKEVYSCGKGWSFNHIKECILVNDSIFGFFVINGNSALFSTLKGSHSVALKQLRSDIMRNHNKGGQSSVRFARLREESRYNFVKMACEQANKQFSSKDQQIDGYIIAGSAGLKMDFINNETLSPSIKQKILGVIDVAQGSQSGLKLSIAQSREILINRKLLSEKKVLNEFFELMSKNSDKITNGLRAVTEVVQIGIAEKVLISKDNFKKEQSQQIESLCQRNGCLLVSVSNKSEEGEQFLRNYGGIGAILRYEFNSNYLKNIDEDDTGMAEEESFFL